MSLRHLRIAARGELISLIILLTNLATAHLEPVSSLTGPTHGCAYLFVVVTTWRLEQATTVTQGHGRHPWHRRPARTAPARPPPPRPSAE
ncbi:DUF3817 domain-containing protein [Streptomyces sp. NPDC008061]|uniref:DUF3817 domain-containing protein n=1 Tax=Streptomyces sp. NPDC008061 TaxID=3364805 RepID=UPI0036E67D19